MLPVLGSHFLKSLVLVLGDEANDAVDVNGVVAGKVFTWIVDAITKGENLHQEVRERLGHIHRGIVLGAVASLTRKRDGAEMLFNANGFF